MSGASDKQALFGDDPLGPNSTLDSLDISAYAEQLVAVLQVVRQQTESSVLAVIGPWGSGKSSLLNLVVGKLSPGPWTIAHFNPWVYANQDALQDGFFSELRAAMGDEGWKEPRKAIGALGRAVAPLGRLTTLVGGPDSTEIIKRGAELAEGERSVSKIQRAAESTLREANRPVLVVLDDLDRLTPDELLLTLKLVRLVGRLPNVYYLLSYDEQTLVEVLMQTPLIAGGQTQRAREYLEKIVQVRLDLPILRDYQRAELVNARFAQLLDTLALVGQVEVARIAEAYAGHLNRRLATPRAINRFFAQVAALYNTNVHGEVDFVDFFLLTWIRTAEPGLYFALSSELKAELTGASTSTSLVARLNRSSPPTRDEQRADWHERLANAGVKPENGEGVLTILGSLFVPIGEMVRGYGSTDGRYADIARRKGVGHGDYFDRYFSFGVPPEDVPDADVRAALAEMSVRTIGSATVKLVEQFARDPARVLRKINVLLAEQAPPLGLVQFLAGSYALAPDNGSFDNPRRSVVELTRRALEVAELDELDGVLEWLSADSFGVSLLAQVFAELSIKRDDEGNSLRPSWYGLAAPRVAELVRANLELPTYDDPRMLGAEEARSIWAWGTLDNEARQAWLRSQVEAGRWALVDILGALQQGSAVYADHGLIPIIGQVYLSSFDEYFGLGYIFERLPAASDGSDVERVSSHKTNPTFEERRDAVVGALLEERQRRQNS